MDRQQVPELMKFIIDNSEASDMQASLKDLKQDMEAFRRTVESATNVLSYSQDKWKKIATEGSQAGYARQEIVVNKADAENVLGALLAKSAQFGVKRDWQYDVTMQAAPVVQGTMKLASEEALKMAKAEAQRYGGDVWRDPTKSNPDRVRYFYQTDDENILKGKGKTGIFRGAREWARAEMAESERVQFIAQEKEEKKKEQARVRESSRKSHSIMKGIFAFLGIAVDLLRRLVSASLQQASQNNAEGTRAHGLGMTTLMSKEYGVFDTAHGLPKGTTVKAVQDIQSKFGDITNLDEGALGILARVMGPEVSSLVYSGMGGDSPDILLEKILDKYFEQFKQGKNSLGQTVGQNAAMRELSTVLGGISGNLESLFLKMADDYMSGAYGEFGNTKEWRETTTKNPTGLSVIDTAYNTEIGKKLDQVKASIDGIKTGVLIQVANSLAGILDWVSNLRWGMSDAEKLALDTRNMAANQGASEEMLSEMASYEKMIGNTSTGKSVFTRMGKQGLTLKDLALIGSGVRSKKDYSSKAKYEAGMELFKELMSDPTVAPMLGLYGAEAAYYTEELNPELQKNIGSDIGNKAISDVTKIYLAGEFIKNGLYTAEGEGNLVGLKYSRKVNDVAVRLALESNPEAKRYLMGKLRGKKIAINTPDAKFAAGILSGEELTRTQSAYNAMRRNKGSDLTDEELLDLIVRGSLSSDATFWLPGGADETFRNAAIDQIVKKRMAEAAIWQLASGTLSGIDLSGAIGGSITSSRREGGGVININLVDKHGVSRKVATFDVGEIGGQEAQVFFDVDDENRAVLSTAQ